MDTASILNHINAELARLTMVRDLLSEAPARKMPISIASKRTISPEGRARIAEGQRKRWAKARKSA